MTRDIAVDWESLETIPLERRSGADRRSEPWTRCPMGRRSSDSFACSELWERIYHADRGDGRRG